MRIKTSMALIALLLITCACNKVPDSSTEKVKSKASKPTDKQNSSKPEIFMLGRSVMAGWFSHWGSDSGSVNKEGFKLVNKELSSPPDIASSASTYIQEAKKGDYVFFKFCFVDFLAGSEEESDRCFEQMKKDVDLVYQKANQKGVHLIIGNALPQVSSATNPELVKLHKQYNSWLESYANDHKNIDVFDLYRVLADDKGNLKSDYSISDQDSHPNDKAYNALDSKFFQFLKSIM